MRHRLLRTRFVSPVWVGRNCITYTMTLLQEKGSDEVIFKVFISLYLLYSLFFGLWYMQSIWFVNPNGNISFGAENPCERAIYQTAKRAKMPNVAVAATTHGRAEDNFKFHTHSYCYLDHQHGLLLPLSAMAIHLMLKVRDLLATERHEGLAIIVDQLFMRQETEEYKSARALYDFCVHKNANCLTLKLLKVYRCSSDDVTRSRSIYLLSRTLAVLRSRNFELSLDSINDIKSLVISCLTMRQAKEYDIKFLKRIVSFVAYNVVKLENSGWDELSDCILSLAITEPLKAFHVFSDLPPAYGKFIEGFMQTILEKACKVLLNPEKDRVQDLSLALETVVKTGIQLTDNTEMRMDLIKNLTCVLVKSASDLVEKGMEQFLVRGLEDLERFLSRDNHLYNYNEVQCVFVSVFMFRIRELGTLTNEATKKISRAIYQQR